LETLTSIISVFKKLHLSFYHGLLSTYQLYVHEADTLNEAINTLKDLNFEFSAAKIRRATIGCRLDGDENRYQPILRTNDGIKWYRDDSINEWYASYNPETWPRVHEWQDIENFRIMKD